MAEEMPQRKCAVFYGENSSAGAAENTEESMRKKKSFVRAAAMLTAAMLLVEEPLLLQAAEQTESQEIQTASGNDVDIPDEGTAGNEEAAGNEETDGNEEAVGNEEPSETEETAGNEEPSETEETKSAQEEEIGAETEDPEESLSDNSISANSISENTLEGELQELIRKAEEAFRALTQEKERMALLYHCDSYTVRTQPQTEGTAAAELEVGETLYISDIEITEDQVWYDASFWQYGEEKRGFVQSYYLAYADEEWRSWEENYLLPILEYEAGRYGMSAQGMLQAEADNSDIEAFPSSYQSKLSALKAAHSNWIFVPMKTKLDFNTSVQKEMGEKSLIQSTAANREKGWVGSACPSESGWYYATQEAVAYHMNPVNFLLTDYVFMFEQLTFNGSYHTQEAVQKFLNGTFMKGTLSDDAENRTYAQAFYEIGQSRKLSPIHLASRVYQEQGEGKSGLISGTYPGYEGYYNYFNVKASGSSTAEKIKNGLAHAKTKGWNTRYKSLEGGAATIGNNYILKAQDTIYLEKFNVSESSPYGVYEHQYMQNIQAPRSEASNTKKMYAEAGSLNSPFVFKIPVYNNMPGGSGLVLDQKSLKLNKGESTELSYSFDGVKGVNTKAEWSSEDASVASVKDGVVTAHKVGETKIAMTYVNPDNSEKSTASCTVTVLSPLTAISISRDGQVLTAEDVIVLRRPDTVTEDTTGFTEEEKRENTDEVQLQVIYEPEDTTDNRTIVWTTSNGKIAKVKTEEDSSRCTVEAAAAGEVTITAKASKSGNKLASCKVRVTAPVYGIELTNLNAAQEDAEEGLLYTGQTIRLAAEYWPKDTTSETKVSWESSAPDIAEVKNGVVTAKAAGETVITASLNGYQDSYRLEVRSCRLIFKKEDGKSTLKELTASYGETIPAEEFPVLPEEETRVFSGWYTKPDGQGVLCEESVTIYQEEVTLYPCFEEQGKGFYVIPVGDQVYTGSAVKPEIKVYDAVSYENGESERIELVLKRDYTVSYKNNVKVNADGQKQPTITVTGKGNYAGKETVTFNIIKKSLTDLDIEADDIEKAYTGKVIRQTPVVIRNGKKLKANVDYTVSYPQKGSGAYQKAGTYPIVITGKGGYSGTRTVYETITQDIFLSKASIAKIPDQPYENSRVDKANGRGIEPQELKVTYQGNVLTESTDGGKTGDYTVAYADNGAIGTATVTITAVEGSGFAGSKSARYKITGTSLAKGVVTGIKDREYTGEEADVRQIPEELTLTLNGQELEQSRDGGITGDYVISYANLGKAGRATILFRGINEYSGQIKKTYKITAHTIGNGGAQALGNVTLSYYEQGQEVSAAKQITSLNEISAAYVKGGTKPELVLTYKGRVLECNKDYKVSYANHKAVTTSETKEKKLPKITVTGCGNYQGKITGIFMITDGELAAADGKVAMIVKDVVYKNKKNAYKTTITITDADGKKLQAGKDYQKTPVYTYENASSVAIADGSVVKREAGEEVQAEDRPEAGTVLRVSVTGAGAYEGNGAAVISATYRIVKADLSKAKISVKAQVYKNGRPVTLTDSEITVKMPGSAEPLVCGRDYWIDETSYTNHTKKGKASVVLRGMPDSNYGGEKKASYQINSKTLVWWRNLIS